LLTCGGAGARRRVAAAQECAEYRNFWEGHWPCACPSILALQAL